MFSKNILLHQRSCRNVECPLLCERTPANRESNKSINFIFSNLGIYNHLEQYSKQRNVLFTVYVDDLTFSGQVIPKSFTDHVTSYINSNRGYKCHKIRKYNAETPKVVTGAVIDGQILKVKNSHRKSIQNLLHGLNNKIESTTIENPDLQHYFQVLIGHLFSAGQINGRYYQLGKTIVEYRKVLKTQSKASQ